MSKLNKIIGEDKVVNRTEVIKLLREMVQIPSVAGNEGELGYFIQQFCENEGLNVELQPITEERFNVLITLGADNYRDQKSGLMFHGHYDTVPVMELKDPYSAEIEDGCMWGRGTVDQKGGLAAAIMALIAAKRSNVKLDKPVTVAAVIDEEREHRGSYYLVKSGIEADYAVVTEPSQLSVVLGCKGTLPLKITVKGKIAHASRPWLGINAVEKSLPLLQQLFDLEFPEIELDSGLGKLKGTLNVGVVDAGTDYNNVPYSCVIWLDRRTVTGEKTENIINRLQNIMDEIAAEDPEFEAEIVVGRPDWDWEPIIKRGLKPTLISRDSPIVKIIERAHRNIFAEDANEYVTPGYNELDFLINDLGIPSIQYGPGDPSLCHSDREKMKIEELLAAVEVYHQLIKEICFN